MSRAAAGPGRCSRQAVLLALDAGRGRALLAAAPITALLWLPLVLGGDAATHTVRLAQSGGAFQPWQAFWFLGEAGQHIVGFKALDTWNTDYYALPFVLALACWEIRARSGPPILTLIALAAAYATTWQLRPVTSADVQAALYLAWVVPCAIALAVVLTARGSRAPG
jgi:hypothetical protein